MIGQTVVGHAIAGTITREPDGNRASPFEGLTRLSIIARFADEPELTIMKCLTLRYLAMAISNSATFLPIVSSPVRKTAIAASISVSENPSEASGIFTVAI